LLLDHPVEFGLRVGGDRVMPVFLLQVIVVESHADLVGIAQTDEVAILGMRTDDGIYKADGPPAGPHDNISFFAQHVESSETGHYAYAAASRQ